MATYAFNKHPLLVIIVCYINKDEILNFDVVFVLLSRVGQIQHQRLNQIQHP